jgi:hypothetical protein
MMRTSGVQASAVDELVALELTDLGRNRDGIRTRRNTDDPLPEANFPASLFNTTSQYVANSAEVDDTGGLDAYCRHC